MKLPFNLGSKLFRAGMALKAVSPELCVAGSILFGIGCVVTSCIATVKSEPTVKDAKERVEEIRDRVTYEPDKENEGETVETHSLVPVKDLSKDDQMKVQAIRVNTVVTIVKNYAIPAALGIVSIALNIGGNRILRRNLAATSMALAGMTKSFDEYRKRVIADLGKDKDQEYMYGVKKRTEVEIDPETGEVVTEKVAYYKEDLGNISPYARYFDEGDWDDKNKRWIHKNYVWRDDPWMNQKNLRSIEKELNCQLIRDGFLFLNDVYRKLGLPLSIDGQIVGWNYYGQGGDHAVSFGVFDDDPRQLPCNKAFVEGKTAVALLDFNVDGPIINDLENFFGADMARKLVAYRM